MSGDRVGEFQMVLFGNEAEMILGCHSGCTVLNRAAESHAAGDLRMVDSIGGGYLVFFTEQA